MEITISKMLIGQALQCYLSSIETFKPLYSLRSSFLSLIEQPMSWLEKVEKIELELRDFYESANSLQCHVKLKSTLFKLHENLTAHVDRYKTAQKSFLIVSSIVFGKRKRFAESSSFTNDQIKAILELEACNEWSFFKDTIKDSNSAMTRKRKRFAFDLDNDVTSEVEFLLNCSGTTCDFWSVYYDLLPRMYLLARIYSSGLISAKKFSTAHIRDVNDLELKLLLARSWLPFSQ